MKWIKKKTSSTVVSCLCRSRTAFLFSISILLVFVEFTLFSPALHGLHSHTRARSLFSSDSCNHTHWATLCHVKSYNYSSTSADAIIQDYFLSYTFLQKGPRGCFAVLLAGWGLQRHVALLTIKLRCTLWENKRFLKMVKVRCILKHRIQ